MKNFIQVLGIVEVIFFFCNYYYYSLIPLSIIHLIIPLIFITFGNIEH